jgi:nickel-dependent lactate racemase
MELKYGSKAIDLKLERGKHCSVLASTPVNGLSNPRICFHQAIEKPVAGSPLLERIKIKKPVTIALIVEDKTRKNLEYPVLLADLIDMIHSAVLCRIKLVIGYGSHPKHTVEENHQLYGSENLSRIELIEHDAHDPDQLVKIANLSTGNVLWINQNVANADLIISLGDITPHAFAGFSGGRKSILPGVSGYQTIERNHQYVSDPRAGLGQLEGNPIHHEMMEAARLSKLYFIINSIRNSEGKIIAFVAGDSEESFYEGVRICRETNGVKIPAPADVVYVSCGGHPKDRSLYHAQRAVIAAVSAVKKGGTIVVFGEFSDGVGDRDYEEWLQKPLSELLELKREYIRLGVHSAYLMARNLNHAEILLFTTISEELVARLHFRKVSSLGEIQRYIEGKHGSDHLAYIIPNGSQVLLIP